MMKIYLTGRYSRISELNQYAKELSENGHTVTSRWLHGFEQTDEEAVAVINAEDSIPEIGARFAQGDLEDINEADAVIAFTERPRSNQGRGGRHVEFGIAVALEKGLIVVGPRENIFHCLPQVEVCDTWSEALSLVMSK